MNTRSISTYVGGTTTAPLTQHPTTNLTRSMKKTVLSLLAFLCATAAADAGPVPTFMTPQQAWWAETKEWIHHFNVPWLLVSLAFILILIAAWRTSARKEKDAK